MGIYEYNEQFHIQNERQDAYAEGHEKGHAEGRAEGHAEGSWLERLCRIRKKREKGITAGQAADMLELQPGEVEEIYSLLTEYPDADEKELYKYYLERPGR